MSSNYLTVVPVGLDVVRAKLRSHDPAFEERLKAAKGHASAAEQIACTSLLQGTFTRDPKTGASPDAHLIVRAFMCACKLLANSALTIETYVDEDRTPLLWEFAWSDWDGGEDLGLPFSEFGIPAVTWHGPDRTIQFLSKFEAWRTAQNWDRDCLSGHDLDELIGIVRKASGNDEGVFVFIEE